MLSSHRNDIHSVAGGVFQCVKIRLHQFDIHRFHSHGHCHNMWQHVRSVASSSFSKILPTQIGYTNFLARTLTRAYCKFTTEYAGGRIFTISQYLKKIWRRVRCHSFLTVYIHNTTACCPHRVLDNIKKCLPEVNISQYHPGHQASLHGDS